MQSILLLRSENQRLLEIERYLESRGFELTVTTRIHDAVKHITEKKPDFALISTELIPRRSQWLFGILRQLTSIILFVERISAKNLAVTRELKDLYLLQPPLTPLGFEKILHRIARDQRKQTHDASQLDTTNVWIMSTLSDLALKTLCISGGESIAGFGKVEAVTRVTCLRVEALNLNGYFILVHGQNRSLDSSWTTRLKEHLNNYLISFDERASIDAANELTIEEVKFDEWTKAQADFIRQATHQDDELVLAFFKDPIQLKAIPSSRKDHIELDLETLQGDSHVNFDIYIYLPQNTRFILYTPRGGTFYESQKENLNSKGIRSFHIHKQSLDEVRRYRAQKFIENSTAAFSQ